MPAPMNMMTDIPPFEIRNAFRDPRAVHHQEEIRRAMLKGLAPVKEAPLPKEPREPRTDAVPRTTHAGNCRAILSHLQASEDSRVELAQVTALPKRSLDRALRDLRDRHRVERFCRDRVVMYRITPAGTDWLAMPMAPPVEKGAAHPKKAPTNAKIDAVFAVLSAQPATRAALARALGLSRSAIDDCLRLLRIQGLIVWTQDPMTTIKTYAVKP